MTTVMQWGNSEGIQGRCDAKCHEAMDPDCTCMCGGRYHGAAYGPGGVEEVARRDGEEILERARARAEREGWDLEAFPLQGVLF